MNKTIVIGGVAVIIVIGGFLLYLGGTSPEEEYSTTPTQWSQAGDYKIEETAEGTLVTNEKAGFSFMVPEGWDREESSFGDQYSITFIDPDAKLRSGVFLEEGCSMGIETRYSRDFVMAAQDVLEQLLKDPDFGFGEREVVSINSRQGTKETLVDQGMVYFENSSIEVPLRENILLVLDFTERTPLGGICKSSFDSILASFVID